MTFTPYSFHTVVLQKTLLYTCQASQELSIDTPYSGTMAHHPTGETVEILGLNQATNGRSCPDHENCGSVVKPDVVVRL